MAGDVREVSSAGSLSGFSFGSGRQQIDTLADLERKEKIREFGQRITNLEKAVGKLQQSVTNIDEKMNEMLAYFKDMVATSQENISTPKVIIVEEMDKSTAKQKVFDFIREHKTSDIEELHENIRCDIRLLVEIIDELYAEGAIIGDE